MVGGWEEALKGQAVPGHQRAEEVQNVSSCRKPSEIDAWVARGLSLQGGVMEEGGEERFVRKRKPPPTLINTLTFLYCCTLPLAHLKVPLGLALSLDREENEVGWM